MIRDIYQSSDFETPNASTSLSREEKLAEIADAPVHCLRYIGADGHMETLGLSLPYTEISSFYAGIPRDTDNLVCFRMSLGDPELYGQGIGTRILRAVSQYTAEKHAARVLLAKDCRLGFVNTAIKVYGQGAVKVRHNGQEFGRGCDRSLEEMLDEYPVDQTKTYVVRYLEARFDPDIAAAWEPPVVEDTAELI
ncbi:MAG: hypothetical protein Q7T41_04125 [Candidatus Saccharibacteria bacterium]|nr:hypothetical protein [Candidatus Saccharibacteria bacterium]